MDRAAECNKGSRAFTPAFVYNREGMIRVRGRKPRSS